MFQRKLFKVRDRFSAYSIVIVSKKLARSTLVHTFLTRQEILYHLTYLIASSGEEEKANKR